MPKLSSNQLFVVALVGLAILAAVAYFDRTYIPVVVSVVLAVLGVGGAQHASASGAAHVVAGVNLAIPLAPAPTALPVATLEATSAPTPAVTPGLPPAMPSVSTGASQA